MTASQTSSGRVASLHIHGPKGGLPLTEVAQIRLIAGKGIQEDKRYFGRKSRSTGQPSRRQVTLIEREMIADHATTFGVEMIGAGDVRSNIETTGVDLLALVGHDVQVGEAIVHFYEPRTPCAKMDALIPGLREAMENGRQGVLAFVVQSGAVVVGDVIRPIEKPVTASTSR